MEAHYLYGCPLIFRSTVSIKLKSTPEVSILLKPLSYSTISASHELYYLRKYDPTYFSISTQQEVLKKAIVGSTNTIGFPSLDKLVDTLWAEDVKFLYDKLMAISSITIKQLGEIESMLEIQFHPQFSDESWNCSMCQEKKLDWSRGCGFLPENARDPKPHLPRLAGKVYTTCPLSTIDGFIMNQVSTAHQMFTAGVLPEDGGIGNQTEWFVKSALLFKRKLAEAESARLEQRKKTTTNTWSD